MNDDVKDLVCALASAFDQIDDAMEAESMNYFLGIAARLSKREASKSGLLYLKEHLTKICGELKRETAAKKP